MEIPKALEGWSWIAGIASAVIAFVTITWQAVSARAKRHRRGDWEVLKSAFHGIRIGASARTLQSVSLKPVARDGDGNIKMTKWELPDGNRLSTTYDSKSDRILYVELDWCFESRAADAGIGGFTFGKTTLADIRVTFGSNGFSYADHMMFMTEQGLIAFNAFELKQSPTIIVVFVSLLRDASAITRPSADEQISNVLGKRFELVAIAVGDEHYLDEIWGMKKVYDPMSTPIELPKNS